MELFTAGSESQLETIKKWIDDSDAFLLILGGRYGSIEPKSKKSYIELEYQQATSKNIPHFTIILSDAAISNKITQIKTDAVEQDSPVHLKKFKSLVMKKMCSIANDKNELKLAVFKSLREISDNNPKRGWVPATETPDTTEVLSEIKTLTAENRELRKKLESIETKTKNTPSQDSGHKKFAQIFRKLSSKTISIDDTEITAADAMLMYRNAIITGINNGSSISGPMRSLYFKLVPLLKIYGLVEDYSRPGIKFDIQRASQLGREFIAWTHEIEDLAEALPEAEKSKPPNKLLTEE